MSTQTKSHPADRLQPDAPTPAAYWEKMEHGFAVAHTEPDGTVWIDQTSIRGNRSDAISAFVGIGIRLRGTNDERRTERIRAWQSHRSRGMETIHVATLTGDALRDLTAVLGAVQSEIQLSRSGESVDVDRLIKAVQRAQPRWAPRTR